LYQVGSFPSWNRFAEWNGKYRDDMRRFLKGDNGMAQAAALRLTGSADLYPEKTRGRNASVNFLNCHDGFTLYDLYSYNEKHNEANGWDNTDGDNNGHSWNCGTEGETDDAAIQGLRRKMIKNACVSLLCSRGTPMFYAGDEFGNTQYGNNNPYCQDNEISWLDWSLLKKNEDIYEFFKFMIHFRRRHAVLRKNLSVCSLGFPFVSTHGNQPFVAEFSYESKQVGVMFAGRSRGRDDIVYAAFNAYWGMETMILPDLKGSGCWQVVVDTAQEKPLKKRILPDGRLTIGARSAVVLVYVPSGSYICQTYKNENS
ncbi:MAG TPA: glycogen debranching enzyme, partial [Lachnospiraceae bacterium]|nr:glycogen debranching enzyme [Lachnospiraceae bacterium]